MVNLTEIMFLKDYHAFVELLNRIRVKQKTDPLSIDDKTLLTQAIADIKDTVTADELYIFTSNKDVEKHNAATIAALHSEVVNIPTEDYRKDP